MKVRKPVAALRVAPGVAVTRPLKNAPTLAAWARSEGFADLRPSFWHVTVIYSNGRPSTCRLESHDLQVDPSLDRRVERLGELIVLSFQSPALTARHHAHRQAGGMWDFVDYRPHVSFTPNNGQDLRNVRPFGGRLLFGPEVMD